MAATTPGRNNLDVSTPGQAVIVKVVQGTNISISSTGADSGTGDVTINAADLRWDGGATNLNAGTGRVSLGATAVGTAFFTVATPSGNAWPMVNALGALQMLDAATTRTNLGGTTAGQSFFTLANPGAGTFFVEINTNSVSAVSAATMRSDLSLNNVTNDAQTKAAVVPNTAPGAGQLMIGTGVQYLPQTISGSGATIVLNSSGVLTISSIANASLAGNTSGWDTAVTEKRQWDGGATNLVAATGRVSLGLGDAAVWENASTAQQTGVSGFSTESYLTGSTITLPANAWQVGGQYRCLFDMVKTAAGVAAPSVIIRIGTSGSITDAAVVTFTFTAGTAAVDTSWFEIVVTIRAIGASASGVAMVRLTHNLTNGGISNTGTIPLIQSGGTTFTATFNSTTATKIGLTFTGGLSFSGTNQIVQASYIQ